MIRDVEFSSEFDLEFDLIISVVHVNKRVYFNTTSNLKM